MPIAYWLMGAERIITYDLHCYLDARVLEECLASLADDPDRVVELLGERVVADRLNRLLDLAGRKVLRPSSVLDLCGIQYHAPADAADTGLPDACVDFHCSRTVMEHVPREDLKRIILEAGRIVSPEGLLVHRIDYSDHFSHSDRNISAINFLQFSEREWHKYAGNRFMFMNRLRHDDLLVLLDESGQEVLEEVPQADPAVRAALEAGEVVLDERFSAKSVDVLGTRAAWITSRTRGPRSNPDVQQ